MFKVHGANLDMLAHRSTEYHILIHQYSQIHRS
jgi:hypothetical protein